MPTYESPNLFIDFARLPPPAVIETIRYEDLLDLYQDRVLKANPALEKALQLEQSPINIVLETEAYGEMMVRARVNAAARAVMLPFAVGSDLDVLGALYNEARLPLVDNPRPYTTNPEDWEGDTRFRSRVQMAPEAFTTAGSAGSYIYHAKSADPTILDASVMKVDRRGGIKVSIMNSGASPVPTTDQINKVTQRLLRPNIKPLTDVVSVTPVKVIYTDLVARVVLYPGPDAAIIRQTITDNLQSLRSRIALIGRDLTRAAITDALYVEGVQNVNLTSPAADIVAETDTCVWLRSADVTINGTRTE
ncbi:baseplate J/gp47 family protein [Methylobacterium ajmalii]|uniref:Baseplate J/gp47 family protein n=1 Tax=Methylobacterium ajmalii TaxID=2738439 RepID=A0ABV0A6Y5_9HYPH